MHAYLLYTHALKTGIYTIAFFSTLILKWTVILLAKETNDKEKNIPAGAQGHRQRVFDDIKRNGAASLSDRHLIETLLFFVIKRQDTRPMAVALLEEFGSIKNVFNASHEELTAIDGVGDSTATFIELLGVALERCNEKEKTSGKVYIGEDSLSKLFRSLFKFDGNEHFAIVFLDERRVCIASKVFEGTSSSLIAVDSAKIADMNAWKRAAYVAIAHTHPDGILIPSQEDYAVTDEIESYARHRNVDMLGHFILDSKDFTVI